MNKVKDLFTLNEIKESIFDNKFNRNKSKKRKPFDTKRTKLLKSKKILKIKQKFLLYIIHLRFDS